MKNLVLALFCTVFSSVVFGQNILKGQVNDAASNEALAFVNVYIPQIEKGTTSDESGNFELNDLPNGTYKIIASYLGFESYSQTVSLPFEDTLIISLNPSAIEIDEVILSTPFHQLQRDNVMKVEQKKIKELKANGAINLASGISDIAGVESVSTGVSIGKPVIRGLSSNRVLVYAQGVRLENQQFGDEHGLGISDSGIESIEVIKGPASLLYGSDALGGVLYINPERFASKDSTEFDVNLNYFSNTRGINTNAGVKTSFDKFKMIFRAGLAEHSDYEIKDLRVTNTRYKEKDFKAALGYQITNFKTEFRYNINSADLGLPEDIGIQNTDKQPMLPSQLINNHTFSSKSKFFLNNSSIDANFGFIYNDRKEFEDHDEEGEEEEHETEEESEDPALHMKLKTFNYDLKYNLPVLDKFETIVGVQGMFQENLNYGEETLIPNATTTDFGVLGTSHIHFDAIDVQLGLRFDRRVINITNDLNRSFNSVNAALGAKTNLFKKLITRINLASGFRAPNLAELTSFGIHEGTNRFEIGNIDLNKEQNFQADLAFEYQSEHLEVFANVFYNYINDFIFISPTGNLVNDDPEFIYEQENAMLYGGEFGVHIHPHPLDWLHFESSFQTVTAKQENGDYLPLIPAAKLDNIIRVEFDNSWFKNGYGFFKLSTSFDQNNVSDLETQTSGYTLLSAGIGSKVTLFNSELDISLTGTNLTDKAYINHLSRLKSDGISNIGRNLSLGITYEF